MSIAYVMDRRCSGRRDLFATSGRWRKERWKPTVEVSAREQRLLKLAGHSWSTELKNFERWLRAEEVGDDERRYLEGYLRKPERNEESHAVASALRALEQGR